MSSLNPHSLAPILRSLGLADAGEDVTCRPLAGGVSSDIVEVTIGDRRLCVKQALSRLKVAAHWEAPVERNAAEAAWMRAVAAWRPDTVPTLLAEDRANGLFVMEFLPPELYPVWKAELLDGRIDEGFAAAVGDRLGAIHARSARNPDLARLFDHGDTFEAIRIEPYLRATARAHPALKSVFDALAARTLATRLALVHGDVSPKNILCGPAGPVFLDAECACYGDPAFDLSFCLNHLLLKAAHRPDLRARFLAAVHQLAGAYAAHVDWEDLADLEQRCASLLPALMLARIDGKSPVEYFDGAQSAKLRQTAIELLRAPETTLEALIRAWSRAYE